MGKGVPGCVGVMVVFGLVLAFITHIFDNISSYLQTTGASLGIVLAIIGLIGLVVFFAFGQQERESVVSRGIDADLSKVLAQVDAQEPLTVRPELSTTSVDWQESVIRDTVWRLEMRFARDTEDGKIYTTVRSEHERAIVRMDLNGSSLVYLDYVGRLHWRTPGQKENPEAVRHVREWMRHRILPELESAKTRRESESMRLAAERESRLEEDRRRQEKLRQKYLP